MLDYNNQIPISMIYPPNGIVGPNNAVIAPNLIKAFKLELILPEQITFELMSQTQLTTPKSIKVTSTGKSLKITMLI